MKKSDLILTGGVIYTIDSAFSMVNTLVISEGKIVATGDSAEIFSHYKADSIIHLAGKPVYPGFNDAHCHFYGYGLGLVRYANLRDTKSAEEIVDRLKLHHKNTNSTWILGRGWDQNDWPVKAFPDKTLLDQAFPENPVYLVRIDGHAAWVNSAALKLAGIDADTKIPGGQVLLVNGEPGGILIDNAMDQVTALIPEPSKDDKTRALMAAQENCFELGLTSVTDAGLDKEIILLIDSLHKSGELKMRIDAMLSPTKENFETFLEKGIYSTGHLRVGSIKLYADGALGSRGALLLQPYTDDPGNSGLEVKNKEEIAKLAKLAFDNNYQICTHAIGDKANRNVLEAYSSVLKEKNDRRWRVEHAQIVDDADFELFGKFSVIPSVQPTHATSDMYWADERLGERIKYAYAYQRLLRQNDWLPLGTDFPIEEVNPLLTFYAAVIRKDITGWPVEGFEMANALSKEETLRGMTIWAAKSSFQENEKGSLEPGKWADLVVLDRDIMTISPSEIPGVKVLMTYSGGKLVYSAKQ